MKRSFDRGSNENVSLYVARGVKDNYKRSFSYEVEEVFPWKILA